MREIKSIVVHCSATKPDVDIGAEEIREWHLSKGWSDIGYHYVIRRDGTLEMGRKLSVVGAHVEGFNDYSIGICMVGGLDSLSKPDSNFTFAQYRCLKSILDYAVELYGAEVKGHRDHQGVTKACPCFDAAQFYYGGRML